jgi:ATP-dependent exoDNAse (exonuclease V) alpha subunit
MAKENKSNFLTGMLKATFPHTPTEGQKTALNGFSDLLSRDSQWDLMLLKGYAGTGKTTLIKAVADTCVIMRKPVILLSPTGRGAKVMTDISRHDAYTIHKHIYHFELKPSGAAMFRLAFNKFTNALFIIDEASMIQGGKHDKPNDGFVMPDTGLLRDLFDYVGSQKGNKMIIIGDPAQLPPVNHLQSPALNEEYLSAEFDTKPIVVTLRDIVRQAHDSGILMNATKIRNLIENNDIMWPEIETTGFSDICKPESWQINDMINNAFSGKNHDPVIITVSNKMANKYNEFIRQSIFQRENILDAGDLIMAVKNNYFWLDDSGKDFIANGEMMAVTGVRNTEFKYGFHFADVSVRLLYQKKEPVVDMKILLDTLHLPSPALPHEKFTELWHHILKSYGSKITKKKSLEILREDPYINALQIKFAWALTCHKAQGGQWKKVFADTEFLMKRPADISGLRWLYTAVTRAREELVILR